MGAQPALDLFKNMPQHDYLGILHADNPSKKVIEQEIGVICDLVADYFKGDIKKTALWFQISNPVLGNISPRDMIRCGRYKKLIKFVRNAFEGNNP